MSLSEMGPNTSVRAIPPGSLSATIGAIWLALLSGCTTAPSRERIDVTIPPGSSIEAVAESLASGGVIKSAKAFRIYARMEGVTGSFPPGVYYLAPEPLGEVLRRLQQGPNLAKLIVPEGAMLAEIAAIVEHVLEVTIEEFLAAARDPKLIDRVGARGEILEGYLYPTTYYVNVGTTPAELVRQMVGEFESRWRSQWTARAKAIGYSRDELVTLASIVSGETRDDVDRPLVASVYHNRLARGMRLQADPTVVYALGQRRRLRNRDYLIDSPYNTYLFDGLPPHPIGQPSSASIEAVLGRARTDYLYFVAGANGKHVFSATYRGHLAAIRRIRDPAS